MSSNSAISNLETASTDGGARARPNRKSYLAGQNSPPRKSPAQAPVNRATGFYASVLVMLLVVVQCLSGHNYVVAQEPGSAKISAKQPPARIAISKLPRSVQEMREAILAVVELGDIEEMRTVLEWNELRPELGFKRDQDAIQQWKKGSRDGNGLEILAIMAQILNDAPAQLPVGRDFENNHIFVWPYLSELDARKLTDVQKIELFRLMPPESAQAIIKTGKWTWYRLAIGADGTWHIFAKASTKPVEPAPPKVSKPPVPPETPNTSKAP